MSKGTATTKSVDRGEARIRKAIAELKRGAGRGPHVKVGFLAGSGEHKDADGEPSGLTVVDVAVFNEFGTDTAPERPFMRASARALMPVMAALSDRLLGAIIMGQTTVDHALGVMGERAKAGIQKTIRDWTTPPNAESTIRAKARGAGRAKIAKAKAKGGREAEVAAMAGYDNPLEDTGQMRNSVAYVKVK